MYEYRKYQRIETLSVLSGIVLYLCWPRVSETPSRLSVFHCPFSELVSQIRKSVKIIMIQSAFSFVNADWWLEDKREWEDEGSWSSYTLLCFPSVDFLVFVPFFISDKLYPQTSVLSFLLLPSDEVSIENVVIQV